MRNIVIVAYDYLPNNGGIARLCGDIVSDLERRDIPHLVITAAACVEGENNSKIHRLNARRGRLEVEMIKCIKRVTTKDDIIICDTWHPAATLCILAGRKPYTLAHGAELLPGQGAFRKYVWKHFRHFIFSCCKGVIANSHYTANLVKSIVKNISVEAIPLPVNSQIFYPTVPKPDDNILHICSISRLEKFKGHDFILKTISTLPENYKDKIRLSIAGKGPYKDTLEQLSFDLKLNNIVSFLGFIPFSDMNDFYSSHDLFILCTREEPELRNVEGFGLVFTESQSCGTAVIATRTGGISDAVKEADGGWLIQQDNIDELHDILIKLIENKKLAWEQGIKARERVLRDCSLKLFVDSILSYIDWN